MSLVVCSNSAPAAARDRGHHLQPDGAGGLVPHLLSLLRSSGGAWLFADVGPAQHRWPRRLEGINLHPIPVSAAQRRMHYEIVSIDILQMLFHYLHDSFGSPLFDVHFAAAWAGYLEVNTGFAERLVALQAHHGHSVVLVNDYHLLLVPALARRKGLPVTTRLIYSHGLPWCEPDYFGILPSAIRNQILTSLLQCDDVVFHSTSWLRAFLRCCERHLPDADVAESSVEHRGHRTRCVVAPFPLDSASVLALRDSEAAQRWRARFDELADGRRMLVRVDRLDLWKNHLRGFAAFEALLRRRRRLVDDVLFLTVMALPRYRSPRHLAYETACRRMVASINETYVNSGRPDAVTMIGPEDRSETRHRAVAALDQAAAVLVNPTFEGFSLVAKEAVLLAGDSPVLLSKTAGAYEQLSSVVSPLDPFDVVATTDELEAAPSTGVRDGAAQRSAAREQIRGSGAGDWLSSVLESCDPGGPDAPVTDSGAR
jgi:trehalose 6-phosphate synthase